MQNELLLDLQEPPPASCGGEEEIFDKTNLDPRTINWLRYLKPQHLRGLANKLGKTPQDTVDYVDGIARQRKGKTLVTLNDIQRRTLPTQAINKLSVKENKSETSIVNIVNQIGTLGHYLFPELLRRTLPPFKGKSWEITLCYGGLFQEPIKKQRFRIDKVTKNGTFHPRFIRRIEIILDKIDENVDVDEINFANFNLYIDLYYELRSLLLPLLGPYVYRLDQLFDGPRYIQFHTLIIWAKFILFANQRGKSHGAFELKVFPTNPGAQYNYSAGEVDWIEVKTIDGVTPNRKQAKILFEIAENKFSSIGEYIGLVFKIFGPNVTFQIIDWKSGIGDQEHSKKRRHKYGISPDQIKDKPLRCHKEQVGSYYVLSYISYLVTQCSIPRNICWELNPIVAADIVYFVASLKDDLKTKPIIHSVVESKKQGDLFFRLYVCKISEGKIRADARQLTHLLLQTSNRLTCGNQMPLFIDKDCGDAHLLEKVLQRHKRFVDPKTKVIEIIGEHKYALDYDQLANLVGAGKIRGDIDITNGRGKICCPNPQHANGNENTPSLQIKTSEGRFKCFGCGLKGIVFSPSHRHSRIINLYQKPKFETDTEKLDAHDLILKFANDVFRNSFLLSPGEIYLQERGIEWKVAADYETGYADKKSFNALIDQFPFQQLVHHGFIGFSTKIKPDSKISLWPLLKHHGYLQRDTRIIKNEDGENKWANPYFIMDGRVTWPLTHEGRMTSFYGRMADQESKKEISHRKLDGNYCNIQQGGFLIDNVINAEISAVCEGVIDAISLPHIYPIQTVCAIGGTDNPGAIEQLATRTGPDHKIHLALDNDDAGRKRTIALKDELRKLNFMGEIVDLTPIIYERFPDIKDHNKLLQHCIQNRIPIPF